MRKIVFIASLSIALFVTSCTTSTRVSTVRTAEIKTSLIADLDIDQTKKSGTATNRDGSTLEAMKMAAIAKVLEENKGDVLIEPSFVVESNSVTTTVTVTGLVARYVNVRQGVIENGATPVNVVHPGSVPQQQSKGLLGLGVLGL